MERAVPFFFFLPRFLFALPTLYCTRFFRLFRFACTSAPENLYVRSCVRGSLSEHPPTPLLVRRFLSENLLSFICSFLSSSLCPFLHFWSSCFVCP